MSRPHVIREPEPDEGELVCSECAVRLPRSSFASIWRCGRGQWCSRSCEQRYFARESRLGFIPDFAQAMRQAGPDGAPLHIALQTLDHVLAVAKRTGRIPWPKKEKPMKPKKKQKPTSTTKAPDLKLAPPPAPEEKAPTAQQLTSLIWKTLEGVRDGSIDPKAAGAVATLAREQTRAYGLVHRVAMSPTDKLPAHLLRYVSE